MVYISTLRNSGLIKRWILDFVIQKENIYEFEYFGQIKKIHITIGNNGYIVQAHPIGDDSYKRYLKKGEKNER